MQKVIARLYAILFFLAPLIFLPITSEFFEFNKMVFVYIMTTVVMGFWLGRSIIEKRFIFRRTMLDWPLLIYVSVMLLSTLFSIDVHTSIFGYYSRFNGGFMSILSYALLYWAYVSNIDSRHTIHHMKYFLASVTVVAVLGILEHFGIFTTCAIIKKWLLTQPLHEGELASYITLTFQEKLKYLFTYSCWQQDVQHRVFSTLGQPNWLAAWFVALIPLTWFFGLKEAPISSKFKLLMSLVLSSLIFIAILFTKSRSGFLGLGAASLIFWGLLLIRNFKQHFKYFLTFSFSFLILYLAFNPRFTSPTPSQLAPNETVIEVGGTDSGTIRKIVWRGAVKIWQAYPLLGTGPETFAYAYYQFRPIEHNLVSEWDYVYNKAHNEFLNHLATTGTLGFLAYIALLTFSIIQINKSANLRFPLFAGYIGLVVVNFFNFSVVATQLQLFLFPAIALASNTKHVSIKKQNVKVSQKILIVCLLLITSYTLFVIGKYWRADFLYTKKDVEKTKKAIQIMPGEALYHMQLANLYADYALNSGEFIEESATEVKKAVDLSPANVSLKRLAFTVYLKLATIDRKYLVDGAQVLDAAIAQAPTNPKFLYNLGLLYGRSGEAETALALVEKAIELKTNYKDARLARALLLIDSGEAQKAKIELEYILTNIDPNDSLTRQTLEELK